MRLKYEFILTGAVVYGCQHCGHWQRISCWDWLALLACKNHERRCTQQAPGASSFKRGEA